MLRQALHATFVPGDPGRASRVALWSDPGDPDGAGWWAVDDVDLALPGPTGVQRLTVPAVLAPFDELIDELVAVRPDDHSASASFRAWGLVARHAIGLIAQGRLQPAISHDGIDTWAIAPLHESDHRARATLASWLPPSAHCLVVADDPLRVVDPTAAVDGVYQAIADVLPRTAAAPTISRQRAWSGADLTDVANLRPYLIGTDAAARSVVGLRLEFPADDQSPFLISLQVRSASDPSRVTDAASLWNGTASGFDAHAERDLLIAVRRGARLFAPLAELLDEATPTALEIDDESAMRLFGPLATDLASAGIEVLVPSAMTRTLSATAHAEPPPGAGDGPAAFDLATLCTLTWRATLDGEVVSEAELKTLAEARRPLVQLRDQWVVVDPAVVAKLARRDLISATDTLAAALGGTITIDGEDVQVQVGGAAADLAGRLRAVSEPHELDEPPGLEAELRPYQRRGVAWLNEMTDLGLGGVLADDMGLGKTIQVIALHVHVHLRGSVKGSTLVVCPASIVGNWQREFERFAPGVTVHRYHGANRSLDDVADGDVVVTTYGIARRDIDTLSEHPWGLVIADEAQQIKNPNSSTARAMRKLPATARFGLTGTPVENRLTELWALLDWTTPGLLGSVDTFRRTIAIPVERDRDDVAVERFARLVSPFLLRRRKDDPSVAPDLPPKTETDHPVTLTPEQAGLYRATVDQILESIEQAEGIARRGLVLKLLTALKQICNHPAHYLSQPGPLAGRSGKLEAFEELVTAITDAGDSTLVFTQYVAMGELLVTRLGELGIATEFLHGSQSLPHRATLVDRFQAGDYPVFVVSLKAGGTGLNLTKATHVIHFDRWWNPAVENQASDRAWRIGQDRPVQIHRLISEGTIEDRIATVLAEKQALADAVVGGGEAWLTELSDNELAELVRLGGD